MLEGLKVVEYATYIAAPGAGGILADWGADVIKIEPPGGDPIRRFFDNIGAEMSVNPVFELDNRGKRGVIVDAGQEAGRDMIRRLVADADVFLTNVRPGGLARAGLDPDTLRAAHPRLVYASVTGYGLSGPDADRAGFDIAAFWSRSGMARLMAPKGVDPFPIRTAMGDHICSMATAAGILAALVERNKTGQGRLVEASLLRAATYALGSDMAIQMAFGRVASTRAREDAVQPLANFFRSRDDRWICLVPRQTGDEWAAIRRALKIEALEEDERFKSPKARRQNGPALVQALDAAFAQMDFAELTARLDAENIVWAPVQTAAEAANDPQLMAAGGVVETPRPDGTKIKAPGAPVHMPGFDATPRRPAPTPGQHSRDVAAQLGYSQAEIDALFASRALRDNDQA